jgi:peptidyl-Lys metalloendopeptidase
MYIAATIMVANGNVQDLRVNVIPVQSRFAAVQDVNVILKYSNIGDDTMAINKWYLPEKGLCDRLFEVTRDGEHVDYVGPLCKRRAPTADDMIFLTPGTTVSAAIQLSTVYNMTKSGNYIIQYKMNVDQVLLTTDGMRKHRIASSNGDQESVLQSPPIVVFAVGRRNLLIEQATEASTQVRAITPTYIGCTTSQANALVTALVAAEGLANNAVGYLNGQPGTRYTTWFGSYSSGNWNIAKSHFTKILSALSTKSLSFDCTCPAGGPETYAYVYSNQHYKVYLCGAYWPSVATGTDSKSGTIIHELAHFTILAGTDDHMYGQSGCKSLAQSSPAKALMNSDSLQYFVENNPRLS